MGVSCRKRQFRLEAGARRLGLLGSMLDRPRKALEGMRFSVDQEVVSLAGASG